MRSDKELFIEFKENAMHVLDGESGIDIPLERDATGRVSRAAIDKAANDLGAFLRGRGGALPRVANCSIPARGVSVRRLSVPNAAGSEVEGLLRLQLEAQMPVSPSELAWGYARLNSRSSTELQDFLVIAVKRELLSDYTAILADGGASAEYTLAALARQALCGHPAEKFVIVDTSGGSKGEVAAFDSLGVVSVRSISIGEARLNGALPAQSNEKIYITGTGQQTVAKRIAEEHPNKPVELLDGQGGPGRTAANVGFKRLLERGERPILLGAREVTEAPARQVEWKWAAWAVALAVLALGLRYAEALLFRARVSNKLETIARYRATLPKIDREFNFLNYIKTNQPPYLDTITLLALSAPPGTKIENISMARRGDVTFRGSTGDAEGPGALRSKLIDSGFFSRVVLDEQAPASDGQKVNFRISAQLRPDGARKPLSFPVKAASTNAAEPVASNPKK